MRIQLTTQQLEVGSAVLFLNVDPNMYDYSKKNLFLYYMWKQCHRFSIKASITNVWEPWGSHTEEFTIMDYAVKDKLLAGNCSKIVLIHACWLYQKVLWVHDLLLEESPSIPYGKILYFKPL